MVWNSGRLALTISYEEVYSSSLTPGERKDRLEAVCNALDIRCDKADLEKATEEYLAPSLRYDGLNRYTMIPNIEELVAEFGDDVTGEV